MGCLPTPEIPQPPDIFPLSVAPPALPSVDLDAELCCKIINWTLVPPPLPFGPLVVTTPAVMAVLRTQIKTANDFLRAQPTSCPLE